MAKLLAVFGLLFILVNVSAQNPAAGQKVKVTLVVILASEKGTVVDGKLKSVAAEVQSKNPNLKNFHLKSMATKTLAVKEKTVFPLVDKKSVAITILGVDKEKRVSLAVTAPDQGEIVYRSVPDKFLPIVTRYHTKGKERLILAISVHTGKD